MKEVVGWLAIAMPGYRNFAFFGDKMVAAIIDKYYDLYLEQLSENNKETKISRTDYQNYYRQFCGLWTVDMGNSNGMQFLAPLVKVGEESPTHTLVTITGDLKLPAGKLFIVTNGLPILAQSTVTNGSQQTLRSSTKRVGFGGESFGWNIVKILSPNSNTIEVKLEGIELKGNSFLSNSYQIRRFETLEPYEILEKNEN